MTEEPDKEWSEIEVTQEMLDAGVTKLLQILDRTSIEYAVHSTYAFMERVRRGEVAAPERYMGASHGRRDRGVVADKE